MKHENTIVNEYTLRSKDTPSGLFCLSNLFDKWGKKLNFEVYSFLFLVSSLGLLLLVFF